VARLSRAPWHGVMPRQVVGPRTHLDNAGAISRGPCPGDYYQPIGGGSSSRRLLLGREAR